jgi:hypothetical protein
LGSAWKSRPSTADLGRLHLAQAVFHALRQILLAPLQLGDVAGELLVGAAQARQFASQRLDLVLQVQQAAAQLFVFAGGAAEVLGLPVGELPLRLDALAQLEDGAARLVVLEQRGMAGQRRQQGCAQEQRGERVRGPHR